MIFGVSLGIGLAAPQKRSASSPVLRTVLMGGSSRSARYVSREDMLEALTVEAGPYDIESLSPEDLIQPETIKGNAKTGRDWRPVSKTPQLQPLPIARTPESEALDAYRLQLAAIATETERLAIAHLANLMEEDRILLFLITA